MRRHLSFACAGETLAATLDGPDDAGTGLVILSGGNEIRSGGHRGMAMLAQRLAAEGIAVLRFDRRGVGDSSGENQGFTSSNDDLEAALAALRARMPGVRTLACLGLCDAASALLLHPAAQAADALILLNPWTLETAAQAAAADGAAPALPNAAAIRARYLAKLKNPRELLRLITGGVDLRKLLRGLRLARAAPATPSAESLAARLRDRLAAIAVPTTIVTADKDSTALAFLAQWRSSAWADARRNPAIRLISRNSASHSFASPDDAEWVATQIIAALRGRSQAGSDTF